VQRPCNGDDSSRNGMPVADLPQQICKLQIA